MADIEEVGIVQSDTAGTVGLTLGIVLGAAAATFGIFTAGYLAGGGVH